MDSDNKVKYCGDSSDEDDDDRETWSIICPESFCSLPIFANVFIEHMTKFHKIWSLPLDQTEQNFKVRVCFRARSYGLAQSWVAGLFFIHKETFMLHVEEENGWIRIWVSCVKGADGIESDNNFVTHITMLLPNGTFPTDDKIFWRGRILNIGAERPPKMALFKNLVWNRFSFQRLFHPTRAIFTTIRPQTFSYYMNTKVMIEYSPTLTAELKKQGGGGMVTSKEDIGVWSLDELTLEERQQDNTEFSATSITALPPIDPEYIEETKKVVDDSLTERLKTEDKETKKVEVDKRIQIQPLSPISWNFDPSLYIGDVKVTDMNIGHIPLTPLSPIHFNFDPTYLCPGLEYI